MVSTNDDRTSHRPLKVTVVTGARIHALSSYLRFELRHYCICIIKARSTSATTILYGYTGSRLRYALQLAEMWPGRRQFPAATNLRAHLFILKTLLIRRDLHNLLIKHAVQHHKCMHAHNSSITNRYQFILNYALPVTLTFDVRMNNALRAQITDSGPRGNSLTIIAESYVIIVGNT